MSKPFTSEPQPGSGPHGGSGARREPDPGGPSPTQELLDHQRRIDEQRRVEIDRGVAEAEARRKAGSIPGV